MILSHSGEHRWMSQTARSCQPRWKTSSRSSRNQWNSSTRDCAQTWHPITTTVTGPATPREWHIGARTYRTDPSGDSISEHSDQTCDGNVPIAITRPDTIRRGSCCGDQKVHERRTSFLAKQGEKLGLDEGPPRRCSVAGETRRRLSAVQVMA